MSNEIYYMQARVFRMYCDMNDETKRACADILFATAIEDLANRYSITADEARDRLIDSQAYEALYDLDTHLWADGPDYFLAFYEGMPFKG